MGNVQAMGLTRGIRALWSSGALGGWSDADLVAKFAETRDEAAFEVLVVRHGPMVLRVSRDVLRDSHAAQDAFQATFLVLARKAGSIARPEALASWLHGVARRVARKSRSEAERRRRHEQFSAQRASNRVEPTGPSDLASTLHDELAGLPESCRIAVLLCYFEGLTYDQAAWRLGVTEATIRGRLARARRQLRNRLDARGATAWSLPALPQTWISPTARAASRFATGLPGAASAAVIGLAEGVLRTMIIAQLKAAAAIFAVIAIANLVAASVLAGPTQDPTTGRTEPPAKTVVEAKPRDEPAQQAVHLTLTLDQAIERMLREDNDLRSKFSEIPSAKADLLTASLRANPAFYADAQLVPYGQYTRTRPGRQTQYDVNTSNPIDINKKRQARAEAAIRATKVTEAQYQDAVRQKIDVLARAFVEVLAAQEVVRLRSQRVDQFDQLLGSALVQDKAARDLRSLKIISHNFKQQLAEATRARERAIQRFAPLVALTDAEAEGLEVVGNLDRDRELPTSESLISSALANRPDIVAYRLGVHRAQADVKLQYAHRFQEVSLLTPTSVWDDRFLDRLLHPSTVTVSGHTSLIPIEEWNRVTIQRAKLNVTQSESQLSSLERQVVKEVETSLNDARGSVDRARDLRRAADLAMTTSKASVADYLDGQLDLVSVLGAFKDADSASEAWVAASLQLRQALATLNTAIGCRAIE